MVNYVLILRTFNALRFELYFYSSYGVYSGSWPDSSLVKSDGPDGRDAMLPL